MLYANRQELPEVLRTILPPEAQELYRKTYNTVWNAYTAHRRLESYEGSRQEVAHRKAWAAVRKSYFQSVEGTWQPKAM